MTAQRALKDCLARRHPNRHKYPTVLLGQSWPLVLETGELEAAADQDHQEEAVDSAGVAETGLAAAFHSEEWDLDDLAKFFGLDDGDGG